MSLQVCVQCGCLISKKEIFDERKKEIHTLIDSETGVLAEGGSCGVRVCFCGRELGLLLRRRRPTIQEREKRDPVRQFFGKLNRGPGMTFPAIGEVLQARLPGWSQRTTTCGLRKSGGTQQRERTVHSPGSTSLTLTPRFEVGPNSVIWLQSTILRSQLTMAIQG